MEEKNMSKNKNKKIIIISIIVTCSILILTISTYFVLLKKEKTKAEQTIINVFESLKSNDSDLKEKYIKLNSDEIIENISFDIFENIEYYNSMLDNLEYKIIDTEADFKKAMIIVEISNKNIGKVFSNYLLKMSELLMEETNSFENIEENLQDYWIKEIDSSNIKTEKNIVKIEMVKDDKIWLVIDEDIIEFSNAILPGLSETIENIGNYINIETADKEELDITDSSNIVTSNNNINTPKKSNVSSNTNQSTSAQAPSAPFSTNSAKNSTTVTTESTPQKHNHVAGAWITDSNPTATAPGVKHQVCATCGQTINTMSIPATGGNVVNIQQPTTPGINASTGTNIGTENGEVSVDSPASAPINPENCPHTNRSQYTSITAYGIKTGVRCVDCGIELSNSASITDPLSGGTAETPPEPTH